MNLLVAIDTSVSMTPAFDDGSVGAAVDVVAGLSQVIGWGRELDVCLLADRTIRLPQTPVKDLAVSALTAIAKAGLGCGFRSTPDDLQVGSDTVTYVITDAVPADVDALRAVQRPGDSRHLVLVDGAGAPSVAQELPTTMFRTPPPGVDAATHLLGSPRELSNLVASMVSGISRAGTEAGR